MSIELDDEFLADIKITFKETGEFHDCEKINMRLIEILKDSIKLIENGYHFVSKSTYYEHIKITNTRMVCVDFKTSGAMLNNLLKSKKNNKNRFKNVRRKKEKSEFKR